MKQKKNFIKIITYLLIILFVILISYLLLKPSEEKIINKLNEQAGPLQIQNEFLGPNNDEGLTLNL